MALRFQTSADKGFTNATDGGDATLKYFYEADLNPELDTFLIQNETKWGVNKNAIVTSTDTIAKAVTIIDFVYAGVNLVNASSVDLTVENAKRANIATGLGDDVINVTVVNSKDLSGSNANNQNYVENAIFNVNTGAGDDRVVFGVGDAEDGVNVETSAFTYTYINTGEGNDFINMGSGVGGLQTIDTINAGDGRDFVTAGGGNDTVNGDSGDDELYGNSGDDKVNGGSGADYVDGGSGNDIVDGGEDNDSVWGRAGNDSVFGGAGDDKVSGGSGQDVLTGGAGADRFIIGANDLVLDDGLPVGSKVGTIDTITDFNAADGDVIDVQNPLQWTGTVVAGGVLITNSTLLADSGIFVAGATSFDSSWLI